MTNETKKSADKDTAGRDISLVGFIFAVASIFVNFFTLGGMSLAGLALSIVGRVQTTRAGRPNAYALAGIIVSSIVTVITFALFMVLATWFLTQPDEGYYIDCSGEYEYTAECQTEEDIPYPQAQS